jgi:serine/threonine-protein kinase
VNHVLGGRFVLGRELGSGGVARVFLGADTVLDRNVAVKVLDPRLSGTELARRFESEGRAAARLSHPNIAQVYDAGDDELDGRLVSYVVMEYVRGGDLRKMISGRGKLPEGEAARLGADVAAGLAHAHEHGVIHRDVKPQNVLIDPYGTPKLTDFGIARALDLEGGATSTAEGSRPEATVYSSPEQLSGAEVTPESDVYSLGATLYEAVTGKPPFSGTPAEVAHRQLDAVQASLRGRGASVSRPFEALILSCLADDPGDRPTAAEVREQLLRIAEASASTAGRGRQGRLLDRVGAGGVARSATAAGAAGLLGGASAARAAGSTGARRIGAVLSGVKGRLAAERDAGGAGNNGGGVANREPGTAGDRDAVPPAAPTVSEVPAAPARRARERGGVAPVEPAAAAGRAEGSFRPFQAGPNARAAVLVVGMAALAMILALLLLASVLRGGGEEPGSGGSGDGRQTPVAASSGQASDGAGGTGERARDEAEPEARRDAPREEARAGESSREGEREEPPAPPLEEAANAVVDTFVAAVEGDFERSWGHLSGRYQREIGSLQEWQAEQESLVSINFSGGVNAERVDENTAEVPVNVTEVRQDGTRQFTGTWFLVNEDGQWKLDRFEET